MTKPKPRPATAGASAGVVSPDMKRQRKPSVKLQGVGAGGAAAIAGAAADAPQESMTLEERIRMNRKQLSDVERQIYNLETQYFENANPQGNALKGYDGLLSSATVSAKKAQWKPEDRIFSGSSATYGLPSTPGQ